MINNIRVLWEMHLRAFPGLGGRSILSHGLMLAGSTIPNFSISARPINHQYMAGLLLLYQDYDHNYGLYISSYGGLNPIIIYI